MQALTRIHQIQSQVSALQRAIRPDFDNHLSGQFDQPAPATSAPSVTTGAYLAATDERATAFQQHLRPFADLSEPRPSTMALPAAVDLPARADRWLGEIQAAAERHGVPTELFTALVWSESAFDEQAVSHAGAIGLSQLMPGTAAMMNVDPRDPLENLEGGARYLAAQLERFDDVDLALAAYNAGPARVARTGSVPQISETQNYVRIVTERALALGGGHS